MVHLSRIVRFSVGHVDHGPGAGRGSNTFSGWPAIRGLGAHYELEVRCSGEPDAQTGYLINISEIDAAVRNRAVPLIESSFRGDPTREAGTLLTEVIDAITAGLDRELAGITWHLTPYYSLSMQVDQRDLVLLRQRFEFAAAHRLNCPDLSEQQNRALFGKCNNAGSHGHNYQVEVAIETPFRASGGRLALDLVALEEIVAQQVIARFDHKNLDSDTEEFADINSSVENIARVCFNLLVDGVRQAGGKLKQITVWETEKTSCSYPI